MGLYRVIIEPAGGGKFEHSLPSGSYVFGREADSCDIPINSPEISRRHVQLTFTAEHCTVTDLGSTSGTTFENELLHDARTIPYPFELTLGTCKLSVAQDENTKSFHPDELNSEAGTVISRTSPATAPTPSPANPAGHYTQGKLLAKGGMGAVMEANDQLLGRTVAMKVILPDIGGSESMRLRFIREATILARLEHPSIVPIYEMGRDAGGELFYAMKKVEGRTLQAILDDIRKGDQASINEFTLDRLLTIFRKICDAMAFAHAKGIIHRDLKPENVMVGAFGEVLVMDWGLAKVLHDAAQTAAEIEQMEQSRTDSDPTASATALPSGFEELSDSQMSGSSQNLTMDGAVMGSPQYMPPEQAEGRVAQLDERSDIFSLGGILYAILTLRPPVEGRTVQEVLENVKSGQIIPPSHFSSDGKQPRGGDLKKGEISHPKETILLPHCPGGRVPPSLSAVVMKALALKQDDRYDSVQPLSNDVESYQGGFATSAEALSAWGQLSLFMKRHKAVAIASGVAFVIINALVFGFMIKVNAEKDNALAKEREAHTEKENADKAKLEAEAEKEISRRSAAEANLSLAEAALKAGNSAAMQAALAKVPHDIRDSTWAYLKNQSDTSLGVLSPNGKNVLAVAPNPLREGAFYIFDSGRQIRMMDVRTGEILRAYDLDLPKTFRLGGVRMEVSPDGKKLAVGKFGADAVVVMLDPKAGKALRTWDAPLCNGLKFNKTGNLLLQLNYGLPSKRGISMWDADNGQLLWEHQPKGGWVVADFLPAGDSVLVLSADGNARIHNARTGKLNRTLDKGGSKSHELKMGSNGRFALRDFKRRIQIRNIEDGSFFGLFDIEDTRSPEGAIAWLPSGRAVVSAFEAPDGRQNIRLRIPETGTILSSFLGGIGQVKGISIHPVSEELVVIGDTARAWSLRGQREKWSFDSRGYSGLNFFGADDTILIHQGSSMSSIQRLQASGSQILWQSSDRRFEYQNVSADGQTAVLGTRGSGTGSETVVVLRRDGEEIRKINSRSLTWFSTLKLDPQGGRFIASHIPPAFHDPKRELVMYDANTGQRLSALNSKGMANIKFEWIGNEGRVVGLATLKGQRYKPGSEETVILWDSNSGKILKTMTHPAPMMTLAVAPDGLLFAEAGADKNVRIRDAETLEIVNEFRVHDDLISGLAWHPKRSVLASASADRSLRLWDMETGRRMQEFHGFLNGASRVEFSPSGRLLGCVVVGEQIGIWEPSSLIEVSEPQ